MAGYTSRPGIFSKSRLALPRDHRDFSPGKPYLVEQLADFHFDQSRRSLSSTRSTLLEEHDEGRHVHLAGERTCSRVCGMGPSRRKRRECAVHLRRAGDMLL